MSETDKVFVEKWCEAVRLGKKTKWVAEELRLTQRYVINRAKLLKLKGVKLPSMVGGPLPATQAEIDELNNLIKGEDHVRD